MDSRSGLRLAVVTALVLSFGVPTAAAAPPVPLGGSPLNVLVGERGQLQAFRVDRTDHPGIFYNATLTAGDAGFFLAFPPGVGNPMALENQTFGFQGNAGPGGLCCDELVDYETVSQGGVTGNGTAGAPLTQVTKYLVRVAAGQSLDVTQTTTYVNGSQEFRIHWLVHNASAGALAFKALAAADFFFEGDDAGTGIFTAGPPRFIGGTNTDSGSSGGFVEVPSAPWSAYEATRYPTVWIDLADAGETATATFDNSVLADPADNAGAVEWDQHVTDKLANNGDAEFELIVRSAVPSALQLNPTNAASRQGVPVNVTATALDSNGSPYAGKTLRYAITGANPTTGSGPSAPRAAP